MSGRFVRYAALVLLWGGLLLSIGWGYRQLPMQDCAWCHRTSRLNRHHIVPQATAPALRDSVTNLVVLCRDCHFVLGHRCNWKRANPDLMVILATYTNSLPNTRNITYDE